jgi:Uma2 family endonuclease
MSIQTRLITAEEFAAMPDTGPNELVRGEVVGMPPPRSRHGLYSSRIAFLLIQHVRQHGLGEVLINDAGFILSRGPDTVRGPDVSFIRRNRLTDGELPEGYFPGAPDLAIEVLSPDDRARDVDEKVDMYLDAGCPLVVILSPERRTATLHRPNLDPHIVRGEEALDLSPVVSGFRCALTEIFG